MESAPLLSNRRLTRLYILAEYAIDYIVLEEIFLANVNDCSPQRWA